MGGEEVRLFQKLLQEAKIQRQRIDEALRCLKEDPANIPCSDQLVYRFSKLQDTMGRKLFRALMDAVGDWNATMTMIDILNWLEKQGLAESETWQKFRQIRNEIAHNYEDDPETTRAILDDIAEALPAMDVMMKKLEAFAGQKGLL